MHYHEIMANHVLYSVNEDEPPTGRWSEDGCHLMEQEREAVVCECNHLTHFAILLSSGVEVHTTYTHTNTYRHTHTYTVCSCLDYTITQLNVYIYPDICYAAEDTNLHWLCDNSSFFVALLLTMFTFIFFWYCACRFELAL